ncbi:unnamed protein product [Laminaria digitata]
MVRRFRGKKLLSFLCSERGAGVPGTPRHVCKTFRANFQRLDYAYSINAKSYLAPKVDPIQEPYKVSRQRLNIRFFTSRRGQSARRFLGIDPETLPTTCSL